MDSIQSEANSLIKQLKTSESKVLSSSDDVRDQYLSAIQVRLPRLEQDGCEGRDVCGLNLLFLCGVCSGEPAGV